ncbi:hypothetical protein DL769_002154 [Monosporascus sp. CRB-8-3]|nr:hypothetical protein DL769_002154 [Monosporascus sp. CRB-8-3]
MDGTTIGKAEVLALQPPFAADKAVVDRSQLVLPVAIRADRTEHVIFPRTEMRRFLAAELLTPKLDLLHGYLWLAGLPIPCRPLCRQKIMNRDIYLTERPDEHLVWHKTRILLKPLPEYLLCHAFWVENLCDDELLHKNATGLLLSYSWLVGHQSDFALAQQAGLIPPSVEWPAWTALMADFLHNVETDTLAQVGRRYQYGELRLSRLNSLTRYLPSMWSWDNFFNQYITTSTWYQDFFERNFSWLLAVFVYISVMLSAMQVALATPQLGEDMPFQNMSYGIALMSIAAVLAGTACIGIVCSRSLAHFRPTIKPAIPHGDHHNAGASQSDPTITATAGDESEENSAVEGSSTVPPCIPEQVARNTEESQSALLNLAITAEKVPAAQGLQRGHGSVSERRAAAATRPPPRSTTSLAAATMTVTVGRQRITPSSHASCTITPSSGAYRTRSRRGTSSSSPARRASRATMDRLDGKVGVPGRDEPLGQDEVPAPEERDPLGPLAGAYRYPFAGKT